ncbi:trigger factor [Eubacterium oxidoreducens]|uniref:Trigger factor n=1 Tax=Eubacterium oxidoreducens TaxID=1732 RepID=A0A1G6AC32_EUBOX|nr:trigger factor [Eubacterium oxidoreducens]
MSVQVEQLEHNMAKLTVEVPAEDFEKAIESVYQKQKSKISIQGFRKGKVPRKVIEKIYGADIFYEDAANQLLPSAYTKAATESELDIVSIPAIDITQIEAGKNLIFTAEVATKPDVELGKYNGVTVTKIDCSVSDEELEAELQSEREKNARTVTVTDREVKDGDTVVIDFKGTIDGTAFEGGEAENYSLVIGSHSFIGDFEQQLIGKKSGEDVEVNVSFPEDYPQTELAGKPAVFAVTLHEIKEKQLPELDDEFAQDVSEFDTFAEYKESVKETVAKRKEEQATRDKEDEAVAKIVDKSKMDIPEAMIETNVQRMIDDFGQRIAQQGLSIDQYLQFSGMDLDKLKEQMRPDAERNIKNTLVLEKIAEVENLEVTDEDVEKELEETAAMYNMELAQLKEMVPPEQMESVKNDIKIRKAVDFVMENVKERAKAKTKAEKEAEAKEKEEKPKKTTAKKTTAKKSSTTKKTTKKADKEEA